MQLGVYSKNIKQNENGIWIAEKVSQVSYPVEGNRSATEIEDQSFWFQHRLDCILELLKKYPPNGLLFDVGGGNGHVTMGLQKKGYDSVLLEPGRDGIRQGRSRGIKNIIHGSLEDVVFTDNSVPAIGLFDVLEHIEAPNKLLEIISRSLAPEGYLYLTVPAYQFLWSADDSYAGHFRRYSLRELTGLLQNHGFKIKFSSYLFSILVLPLFLLKALPFKLRLKRKTSSLEEGKREHLVSDSFLKKIILWILAIEMWSLKKSKAIPFGTSCIVVASKQ